MNSDIILQSLLERCYEALTVAEECLSVAPMDIPYIRGSMFTTQTIIEFIERNMELD